jgi:putative transposase
MNANHDIRTGRHCVFALHAHLVFVTKYRRPVFSAAALAALRARFAAVCTDFAAELKAFDGERDHVHLLVLYPPKVSLARLVNSLKGASSRTLKNEVPSVAAHYYRGVLWSPSYFAASCGGAPLDVIREYIDSQSHPT